MVEMKLNKAISFVGKSLLIEDDFIEGGERRKRILVLGDLHLGYHGSVPDLLPDIIFKETIQDLELVLKHVGEVDEIILLGDVKHEFSGILEKEWRETRKFFNILKQHTKKIIVVKGNHDTILDPISRELGFTLVDFYLLGKYGFFHGDKMFDALLEKDVEVLLCGHLHPAVSLREGVKIERYKCFLVGSWKRKKVIILPSFFPLIEGGDIFYHEGNLGFGLDVKKCEVYLVGSGLDVFHFGKMGKLG